MNKLAIVALASCIVPLCRAASPPQVPDSLLACRKLQDDGARVRCYDTQIAKLTGETAAPAPAAAGFGKETLPPAARPKNESQDEPALISSITALHSVGSQTYAITLANGQVWRQEAASKLAVFFRVGDDVRIEKGALGSYHLSTSRTGAKNWVRVTRIQ